MKRKAAHRKKATRRSSGSNSGLRVYVIRTVTAIFGLVLLAVVASQFLNFNFLAPCANSISCTKNLEVQVENSATGEFLGQKVKPPKIVLSNENFKSTILGTEAGEKHIYVDLAKQTLYAYQGDKLFMETLISSGKWGKTPTGDFRIWIKLRSTRMSGGSGSDYYNLPNVPYVMFFAGGNISQGRGFSLHGTYWHNNFGHPMSHGCVNMRTADAERLYNWVNPVTTGHTTYASQADPGTPITIYGQTPI